MNKKIFAALFVLLFVLLICSMGMSQKKYDALLKENEELKAQIEEYKKYEEYAEYAATAKEQEEDIQLETYGDFEDSPIEDFEYVNNGTEVQIDGYKGCGGIVVIPDEIEGSIVTRIAAKAFYDNDTITGIVLPNNLKYIGEYAFMNTDNLTGIAILPDSLEEVASYAFLWSNLTGVVIQSDCVIKINSFAGLGDLEFIYVKEGCAPQIYGAAFSGCADLKDVIFPDTVALVVDDTFEKNEKMVIYTPEGSYAEDYAKSNFIDVNTKDYYDKVQKYSEYF